MKLAKWLDVTDTMLSAVRYAIVYDKDFDDDPIWEGKASDIPYWVANMKLVPKEENDGEYPIDIRCLGKDYDDAIGLIIVVKD